MLSNSSKKKSRREGEGEREKNPGCVVTVKLILLPPGGGLLLHAGDEAAEALDHFQPPLHPPKKDAIDGMRVQLGRLDHLR